MGLEQVSDTVFIPVVSNKRPGDDTPVGGQSAELPRGLGLAFAYERWNYARNATDYQQAHVSRAVWDLLQPQCWHNWGWQNGMDRPRHTMMVWSLDPNHRSGVEGQPAGTGFRMYYASNRVGVVLFGNEPDQLHQGNVPPEAVVLWARDFDAFFAGSWIFPGTIWVGDRDYWVDKYLDAGGMPPDMWQFHWYPVSRDTTLDWAADRMHTWMQRRGVVRPILITETTHRSNRIEDNMQLLTDAGRAINDGRLQAVYWLGPHYAHATWEQNNLADWDGALTALGHRFVEMREGVRTE